MKSEKNIFLIGFMGSGKTTVGKLLAQKMNRPFLDSDHEIERITGQTITELFIEKGESHFRELERAFIHDLKNKKQAFIVSCGGGLPCFHELIDELKNQGEVVFLNASVETLTARLFLQKKNRPLLNQLSDEEFVASIRERLSNRMKVYALANEIIEVDKRTIQSIVEEINLKIEQ